ncbi:MAG: hypothetical protein ACK5MV_07575 [Aminipila sp.]
MNINTVIEHLNKKYGYDLNGDYYNNIEEWKDWWKGFFQPFHEYHEADSDGKQIKRKLYTLKMAKKISEDWASILLNEKTIVSINDEQSSNFVNGDGKDNEGVLYENNFWLKANELVEKSFAMGTGAFVLRLVGMKVTNGNIQRDQDTKIKIEYLPATNIIPLSVKYGEIIDVAFVSEVLYKGEKFVYIETHMLEGNEGSKEYVINNAYFKEESEKLVAKPLPQGILEVIKTGSDIPLFSIIKPNICNSIDEDTSLGISVFANAIDNLMGVDLAYNNFNRDFKLGGKKVFINEDLTKTDSSGNVYTPDDVAQQLFVCVSDTLIEGKDTLIHEHNPELRVEENVAGLQAQLDYLSFKCGLGAKYYQFNNSNVTVTATQYTGEKQDLIKNVSKHYKTVETALRGIVKAILWVGKEVIGANVNPDAVVTIEFDDSYITDKDSERLNDLQEIRDGIRQKYEYRMKWYGEDEETAKSMVADLGNTSLF